MAIYRVGDEVMVDCSAGSSVYAHIKRQFVGRVGVVIAAWSPDDGLPMNYRNCTVKFPQFGRRKEQEIEVNFDNLLPANSGAEK